MDGDFDKYDSVAEFRMEPMNSDDDSVMSVSIENVGTSHSNANIDTQPKSISIPIFRCSKSHHSCVFCDEKDPCSTKVLSRIQRTMIFLKCGIIAAPGSRCCTSHLCEDGLTIKSFDHIRISKPDRWQIDSIEFQIFVEDIRVILFKQKKFDFDDPSCFSDEGYQTIVGLCKEQFNRLVNTVSSMRNSPVRSVRVAVAVFLAKLRLGLSNRVLAVLFNLENKRVVSRINNQVRKALMEDFVPYHLGLKHITRETAIEQHQTAIATILHTNKPNQLCVIADSTYLFIQKSINGQVKQWKYFSQAIQNSSLRFISNYLDITCAIINAFFPKPVSDIHAGAEIAYRMLEKIDQENNIQMHLCHISKERSDWKKYDAKMCIFPELSADDVRSLCCGSYQVKQAISYIQEHLTPSPLCDDEPEFIVELSSNDDNIVRARFSSRHINKKTYVTIIQHDIKNIEQPIIGWYCTCMSGRRDVGCCVHVAALLWHLGVCRAEIDPNDHPLSTRNIYLQIIDSIPFYDIQTSDDEDVTTDDEI
ncbi:unnamed protein product [Rotaria magnacalcarata]